MGTCGADSRSKLQCHSARHGKTTSSPTLDELCSRKNTKQQPPAVQRQPPHCLTGTFGKHVHRHSSCISSQMHLQWAAWS